jgi:hypothetical protein
VYSGKFRRYARYDVWDFVLPTGEQMNPCHPESATYYGKDQTVLVMRRLDIPRTRPTRVITTYGGGSFYPIGSKHSLFHDQTGAFLGDYEVVGQRDYSTGISQGIVPDRLIKQSVFK